MSETKFTQGPWEVDGTIVRTGGKIIIRQNWVGTETSETLNANVHLIAAALDMYAKLESLKRYILEFCGDACGSVIVIREIEELLAKARGDYKEVAE